MLSTNREEDSDEGNAVKGVRTLLICIGSFQDGRMHIHGLCIFGRMSGPLDGYAAQVIFIRNLNQESGNNVLEENAACKVDPNNLVYFDWSGNNLPTGILAEEVPKPGVVVAVPKTDDLPPKVAASLLIEHYLKKSRYVIDFLKSSEALMEPVPMARFDAFISFAFQDELLASKICASLQSAGLRVFQCNRDLQLGSMWRSEVRESLRDSRVVLIVVTPSSSSSQWALCEIGAAWGLNKPIIPILCGTLPPLPDILAEYSAVAINEDSTMEELVEKTKAAIRMVVWRTDRYTENTIPLFSTHIEPRF